MSMRGESYRVFISYCHDAGGTGMDRLGVSQREVARLIHDALADIGIRTAVDFAVMALGDDWQSALHLALREAEIVVLVVTEESSTSKAVLIELQTAESLDTPVVKFILDPVEALGGEVAADLGRVNHYVVPKSPPSMSDYHRFADKVGQYLDVRSGLVDLLGRLGTKDTGAAESELLRRVPRSAEYLLDLLESIAVESERIGHDGQQERKRAAALRTLTSIAASWPAPDGHSWNDLMRGTRVSTVALRSLLDAYELESAMAAARLLAESVKLKPDDKTSLIERVSNLGEVLESTGWSPEVAEFLNAESLARLETQDGLRRLERIAVSEAKAGSQEGFLRLRALDTLAELGDELSLSVLKEVSDSAKVKSVRQHARKCLECLSARLSAGSLSDLVQTKLYLNAKPPECEHVTVDHLKFFRQDVELALRLFELGLLTPSIHNWDTNEPPKDLDHLTQTVAGQGRGNQTYMMEWVDSSGTAKLLPPKDVFRLVMLLLDGSCTRVFDGGWGNSGINRKLDTLGFTVLPRPKGQKSALRLP